MRVFDRSNREVENDETESLHCHRSRSGNWTVDREEIFFKLCRGNDRSQLRTIVVVRSHDSEL